MRFSVLCMLFASVLGAAPTLPPEDLPKALTEVPLSFVMAYAPWCGHCVHAKPAFEEVESPVVPTYLVDASVEEAAAFRSAYGVKGFPTFLLLEHGKLKEVYNGERSREAFESYLATRAASHAPSPSTATVDAADTTTESKEEPPPAPETASEGEDPATLDDSDDSAREDAHDEL